MLYVSDILSATGERLYGCTEPADILRLYITDSGTGREYSISGYSTAQKDYFASLEDYKELLGIFGVSSLGVVHYGVYTLSQFLDDGNYSLEGNKLKISGWGSYEVLNPLKLTKVLILR